MAVFFHIPAHIREQYAKASTAWKAAEVPLARRGLVNQMLKDARQLMIEGDWRMAARTSSYAHEVAKLSGVYFWYDYFLAVKKSSDLVDKVVEEFKRDGR